MSAVPAPIFVTWTQQWDLEQYIEHYLRTRRLAGNERAREMVSDALGSYPGNSPYTKAALDFYLDANLGRDN